jgi:hypothetical protein
MNFTIIRSGIRVARTGAAVLEPDSVPLPVVIARIDRFIAEGGKGPYPDMERAGSSSRRR